MLDAPFSTWATRSTGGCSVLKHEDTNLNGVIDTGEPVERYIWDGDEVVLTLDADGNVTHRFLHGPEVDQVFADETAADGVLWYLTDNLHSVRDVVDSTGTVVNHLEYSAFGRITSETDTDATPFFAYTGREWDEAVNLQYNRRRWYDPSLARWISEDPIRWSAGDTNLYRYVENDPINKTDPSGLELQIVTICDTMYFHIYNDYSYLSPWKPSELKYSLSVKLTDNGYTPIDLPERIEEARKRANDLNAGVSITVIKEQIRNGAHAAEITIRILNEPLDTTIDVIDFVKDPKVQTAVTIVTPAITGVIIRKADKFAPAGGFQAIEASLDSTGKVHGKLPDIKRLAQYDPYELSQLLSELKRSVQKRIEITVKMGADHGHNARIAEEQQLIKSIEKFLED